MPKMAEPLSNYYRMSHRDPDYDSNAEYEYEGSNCGDIVRADAHPGSCSDCGVPMRNRRMPYE